MSETTPEQREVPSDRERDALDRIRELENFICEARPLTWAAAGFPDGTEAAQKWEHEAKVLVERYPDALSRIGMVPGPLNRRRP